MKKYNMKSMMLILLPILVIPIIGVAHAQTANEIDIVTGAGSSAQANCVTTNNCFTPNPLTVSPGTTVTWKNTDTTTHVVCSGKVTDAQCGTVFEYDSLKSGQTFQFTFANAGTYDYFCSIHPWMTGQVIVGASGTVPTPQPTPPTTPNNSYLGCPDCNNIQQTQLTSGGTLKVGLSTDPMNPNTTSQTQLKINFLNKQDSNQPHIDYKVSIIQGSNQIFGIPLSHTASGSVTIPIQFQNSGTYQIIVEVDGVLFQPIPPESAIFSLQVGTQMENGSTSHPNNPYLGCPDCNNTSNIQQITPTLPANEIDIATGAGSSKDAACVAANNCFAPNPLTVSPGTTVTWKNTDTTTHVVCSGKITDDQCGLVFEDDSLKKGQTFQFTFANAGTYDYFCSVHPWMIGQVIVGQGEKNSVLTITPTGLGATVISPTQINLSWFAPTQNYGKIIVGYKIEQQASSGVYSTLVNNTASTLVSYSITGLKTGVTYTYRVSAVYSDGTLTDPSNSAQATLIGSPMTLSPLTTNVKFDFTSSDGKLLAGVILSQNDYQQLVAIKDPRIILSNIKTTSDAVNNDLAGILKSSVPQQNIQDINQAKANQTIAAEVNVGVSQSTTTSIDNNVSVQTTSNTPDSLNVNVSASSQTGPKVIAFNLNATTINVANLKDLGVMYDGHLISPAPNMDAILHAKPTDKPSFAIVVTQSGVQVLVLVPHFSSHTITLTNMSKVIPAVPEFGPIVGMIITMSLIGSIIASRNFFKKIE